jgi:hypothetical protein
MSRNILSLNLMCLAAAIDGTLCGGAVGGVRTIYVAKCSDVDETTGLLINPTTRLVTAITMTGAATFFEVKPYINTGVEDNDITRAAGGGYISTHKVSFTIPNQTPSNAVLIHDLLNCCCYIVIVRFANGQNVVLGVNYDSVTNTYYYAQMKVPTGKVQSGATGADLNGYTLDLVAENVNNAGLHVTNAILDAMITAGDIVTV